MGILLKNAMLVTCNSTREVLQGDILIDGSTIKKIDQRLPAGDHSQIDLSGRVVIPGLIQSHIHLTQTLFRNLADDLELLDWLEQRIWPMEMAHNEDSLRTAARLGLAELLLSGTTCILDMGNASHQEIIFEEMAASGIRGFSGKVMMDKGRHPYREETDAILKECEALIRKWNGAAGGRLGYALAPRFVPSCSEELWDAVRRLSETNNLLVHTHASENRKEWQLVKETTGFSNVAFFEHHQLANRKLCLAHCIWVSPEEIELLQRHQISVLHCPSANLKLGSGIAPIPVFWEQGITVGLGSDGAACNNNLDLFNEMRLAALIQKPGAGVTSTSAQKVFEAATLGGAQALGLQDQIGSLEPGKKADLAVLDLNNFHSIPADNIYSQIVYSARAGDVQHVMIDGQWVVWERRIKMMEVDSLLQNSWREIKKLLERTKLLEQEG
ncbi:MAG: 5'-deoxyadenosine deaminase [Calditrichia bacterium]